jgi:6-phosphofructokinase 1
MERLTELLIYDRRRHQSKYSVVLVSEGARPQDQADMIFEGGERDHFGHRKLGGIGDLVSARLKELSPQFNDGVRVNVVNQRLGYLVRSGDPDAVDSIVPMAFGNLALDLILAGTHGRLVGLRNGVYDSVPIEVVVGRKKVVDIHKFYNADRLRPKYTTFEGKPLFIMTSDV